MPTGAAAYYRKRPIRLKPGFLSGDMLNAHRGSGLLPKKPDPAEAGIPERRYLDSTFKLHQSGLLSSDVRI
jgi:hypothetical protein